MWARRFVLAGALFALAASSSAGLDDPKPAALKETLKVKNVQGGFAGFTGKQITIEPDGSWDESAVRGDKLRSLRQGKLGMDALAKLAAEVGKYGPDTLKNSGKPTVNPRVITISYGKNQAVLNLPAGGKLPRADAKALDGRFAGIVAAVQSALPKAKPKDKKKKAKD